MKRFILAFISVMSAGICGCNIDLAVDSKVAECIKVGGIFENGKCKCGELTNPGCKDENDLQHTCNKGILEIFKCPDDSACTTECSDNATCTKKCGITCQNGERRCIKGVQVVCEDNTWNYEYKCATSCAESGDTCEKCDEQYLSCIDNIYERCENGVLIQGECPLGCDTKTKECKKCDTNITTCNGDDVLECKDGNWEKQETCGVGETCIEGMCKCLGNVTKCDGTNMLQTCVDGKWNGGEPCPNGQICNNGACVENSGNGETSDTNKACEKGDKRCNGATSQICENGSWKNNEICEGGCDTNTGECNLNDSCQSYESLWETINDDDRKCLLNEKMLQEIINRLKASNHNNNIKPQATFFIVSEKQSYSFRVVAHIETDNYELYYSDENAITSIKGKLNICNIGLSVDPSADALRELKKSQISGIALLEFDADSEKCSTIVNIPKEEMSLICKNDESSKWTCNDNNVLMCASNNLYQLGFEGNDYYSWQSKPLINYSEIDWDVSENIPWHTQNEELLCKINKKLIDNAYTQVTDSHNLYVKVKGESESKCELVNNVNNDIKCGNRSLEEICKKEISEISIWGINNKEPQKTYSCQTDNLSISDLCNDIKVSSKPSQTAGCVFVTDGI